MANTQRPVLLILGSDFNPPHSGVGRYIQQLAARLKQDWNVTVAAPGAVANDRAIRSNRLPSSGPSSFSIERLMEWTALMASLGAYGSKPDIILANGFMSAIPAQTLSELFDVPWVLTKHCWLEPYDHAPDIAFELQTWAIENASAIVAPSQWMAQRMTELCSPASEPIVILGDSDVPASYSPGAREHTERQGHVFVHSGVQVHKGADRTLDIFHRCASSQDRLIMIGAVESQLDTLVTQYEDDRRICWTGPITPEGAWSLIADADALLAPSRSEGLPLAVIEAQKIGCPVLTTRDTSIAEIVIDGLTGRCAGSDDELGTFIRDFHTDDLLTPAEISATTTQRFQWARTASEYNKLFSTLINR